MATLSDPARKDSLSDAVLASGGINAAFLLTSLEATASTKEVIVQEMLAGSFMVLLLKICFDRPSSGRITIEKYVLISLMSALHFAWNFGMM